MIAAVLFAVLALYEGSRARHLWVDRCRPQQAAAVVDLADMSKVSGMVTVCGIAAGTPSASPWTGRPGLFFAATRQRLARYDRGDGGTWATRSARLSTWAVPDFHLTGAGVSVRVLVSDGARAHLKRRFTSKFRQSEALCMNFSRFGLV